MDIDKPNGIFFKQILNDKNNKKPYVFNCS